MRLSYFDRWENPAQPLIGYIFFYQVQFEEQDLKEISESFGS